MLPKISSYGDYSSSNYGAHTLEVNLGTITLYYSYSTIVAFRADGALVCSENVWSTTTGKHLNQIQPNKRARVKHEEFEELLQAALQAHVV